MDNSTLWLIMVIGGGFILITGMILFGIKMFKYGELDKRPIIIMFSGIMLMFMSMPLHPSRDQSDKFDVELKLEAMTEARQNAQIVTVSRKYITNPLFRETEYIVEFELPYTYVDNNGQTHNETDTFTLKIPESNFDDVVVGGSYDIKNYKTVSIN